MKTYMTETCATCAHRDPKGTCRAGPPTPMLLPVQTRLVAPGGAPQGGMAMASVSTQVDGGAPACALWEEASDAAQAAPPPE